MGFSNQLLVTLFSHEAAAGGAAVPDHPPNNEFQKLFQHLYEFKEGIALFAFDDSVIYCSFVSCFNIRFSNLRCVINISRAILTFTSEMIIFVSFAIRCCSMWEMIILMLTVRILLLHIAYD